MQEKTQVNQVLHGLSRYGTLLFIYTIFFFSQIVSVIFVFVMGYHPNLFSATTILIIELILEVIIAIFGVIVVLILMIKAIQIRSKAHEPALNLFFIFSILWFVFYLIENIITIWSALLPTYNPLYGVYNIIILARVLYYVLVTSLVLSTIFQLCVWISLRRFFHDRKDLFPMGDNRKIQNKLVFLIVLMGIFLYINAIPIFISLLIPLFSIYSSIFNGPLYILLIIGYTLLGYRLKNLKISADSSIPER